MQTHRFASILPCALAALALAFPASIASAQDRERTVLHVQPRDAAAPSAPTSTSTPAPAVSAPPQAPAGSAESALRSARVLYVLSTSRTFDSADLEAEIVNVKKFRSLGLSLTRDESTADVVVELRQGEATITLGYTLVDIRTRAVVGGGSATSIFGFAPKMVAKEIVDKIAKARQ